MLSSQFPHKCEKESTRRWIKTIKTWGFGWFEINLALTITQLKWSSAFYIFCWKQASTKSRLAVSYHHDIWQVSLKFPIHSALQWKVKIESGTIGCLYFARAPTALSCQPFASTRLQIIQQGASLATWKLINCRSNAHIILSAVESVTVSSRVKEKYWKNTKRCSAITETSSGIAKKLEVSRFAISFDRQPFPQTHPSQHWTTKTKMKVESLSMQRWKWCCNAIATYVLIWWYGFWH